MTNVDDPSLKVEAELVKKEINLLANALHSSHISESETFNFNPFPDGTSHIVDSSGLQQNYDEDVIMIDGINKGAKKLLKEMEAATDFIKKPPAKKEEKQSLMDLMDEFDIGK